MIPSQRYKIILVDDHILLRDALASLINTFEEFCVVDVAAKGEELVTAIENGNIPNLVMLDLNMPGMDGYDTTKWLQENRPNVKILILTMFDSEIALIRLLQMGVRGFLKKDIHPAELRVALLTVAENGYYYSNDTTGKLASFIHKSHANHTSIDRALLSAKEIDFLKLAGTEMTYKEIAQAMHITARAIDGCRDGLFEKLNVKSRVGLAIYAVKNGIISF